MNLPGGSLLPVVMVILLLGCQAGQPVETPVIAAWGSVHHKEGPEEWVTALDQMSGWGLTDLFLSGHPDQLAELAILGDIHKIRIHAWIWALNRPGDSVAMAQPDWYAVNREGRNSLEYNAYVDYYQWLSPFSKGARNHIAEIVDEVASVPGLASVHLDYIRLPDAFLPENLQPNYNLEQDQLMPQFDYGYHPEARTRFADIFGVDPVDLNDPQLSPEWLQFRLNAITDLVLELREIAHMRNKKISAAVFPFPERARFMVRQDWDKWELDLVLPMLYHNMYGQDLKWIKFATKQGLREIEANTKLVPGLFIPALPPAQLDSAITFIMEMGAAGVSFYNLNALSSDHWKVIRDHRLLQLPVKPTAE